MRRAMLIGLAIVVVAWLTPTMGWAAQAEWRDGGYDFGRPLTILVTETTLRYDGITLFDRDRFNRYPFAKEKMTDLLANRLSGLTRHRFVTMEYVLNQIKGDPARVEEFDPKAPGFGSMVTREMGKHLDILVYLEVRDYGWYYQYHDPYITTETVTDRVEYRHKTRDGREESGWVDVPRTVVTHHPAGYFINDCADAYIRLVDAKSGRDLWKFSDRRTRRSPAISDGFDPSGPESMMNRIFNDAFKKIPLL